MIERNRVFEPLINRDLLLICRNKDKGWGILMHTTGRTLWWSSISYNWNSHRREVRWRSVTMLLNWPDLDSMFQTRLMWRLFITLGRWKVDIHQNQTEICPWSSETRGWTLEASASTWGQSNRAGWMMLWRLVLWDYSAFRKNVEILKNYLQKFPSIKVADTCCALKDDLSFSRVQEEK